MIRECTDVDLLQKEGPVLIDFYAEWCGPCKVMGNNLAKFAELHPEITIEKVDVEEYPEIADLFGVKGLPTIMFAKDNEETWRHTGLLTIKELEEKI